MNLECLVAAALMTNVPESGTDKAHGKAIKVPEGNASEGTENGRRKRDALRDQVRRGSR
jgi:hypothetical protein